jgi:hypothetical protein
MSYLDEIKSLQKIINEYNELKNIYPNITKYILPFVNYIEPYTYNLKTKTIYYNNNKINIDKNINPNISLYQNLSIFSKINLKQILIITSNVNIIEHCLLLNKSQIQKIKLFILNIDQLEQFILLKEKYKNLIDMYYIGYKFDYDMYMTITSLIQNEKFSSIILDYSDSNKLYNGSELATALLILLINNFLDENNHCINYNKLPTQNDTLIYLYNILFNCFYNHNLNDLYLYNYNDINNYKTILLYNNFRQKISKKDEDFLINFLKSDGKNNNNNNNKLSEDFLNNMKHVWEKIVITHKENLERVRNILQNKTKRLLYHRNNLKSIQSTTLSKIPEFVSDIPVTNSIYDDNALDHQSKCHWGQKKLLLSEIQFFTRICKTLNTKTLKDFAVVYIGSAGGHHLPILYNLFPDLIWLLYDPAPFSNEVMKHPTKDKSVFVYNMFFTDDTLDHVRKNCQGRKILFISDIRVDNKEEDIIKDMRNQAFWGTELNSPFMLHKFRLPYEELETIPKSNLQFKLNDKLFTNPNFKTTKNMMYLKGDIYLQIFPPPYSGELRLYVEQKNGKYEFAEYDYLDIENRLVYFNSYIRPYFYCFANDKICEEYKYINYIPGYDTSIECLMEYKVVMDYYNYFFEKTITDKKVMIQKLYDMNFYLEKLAHRKFITCNYDTTIKYLKKTNINNNDKYNKLKIWKEISKFNIALSAKNQFKIIKEDGASILGEKRYNKALDYLKPFITNINYVQFPS